MNGAEEKNHVPHSYKFLLYNMFKESLALLSKSNWILVVSFFAGFSLFSIVMIL